MVTTQDNTIKQWVGTLFYLHKGPWASKIALLVHKTKIHTQSDEEQTGGQQNWPGGGATVHRTVPHSVKKIYLIVMIIAVININRTII